MSNAVWNVVGIVLIVGVLFIFIIFALIIKQYFSDNKGWACGRFMKIINKIKDKKSKGEESNHINITTCPPAGEIAEIMIANMTDKAKVETDDLPSVEEINYSLKLMKDFRQWMMDEFPEVFRAGRPVYLQDVIAVAKEKLKE